MYLLLTKQHLNRIYGIMKHEVNVVEQKFNITVTVSANELAAIDRYLQPLCGKRGPFIRQIILEKVGYKPEEEKQLERKVN